MKKLNEKELVEVKGGSNSVSPIFCQNLFAMRNIVKRSKHPVINFNWKKFFGLR